MASADELEKGQQSLKAHAGTQPRDEVSNAGGNLASPELRQNSEKPPIYLTGVRFWLITVSCVVSPGTCRISDQRLGLQSRYS
jgi:hypothetical protein